jgi:hypothetical protein
LFPIVLSYCGRCWPRWATWVPIAAPSATMMQSARTTVRRTERTLPSHKRRSSSTIGVRRKLSSIASVIGMRTTRPKYRATTTTTATTTPVSVDRLGAPAGGNPGGGVESEFAEEKSGMTHLLRREATPRRPICGQRANSWRDPALRLLSQMLAETADRSLRLPAPSPQLSLPQWPHAGTASP